MSIAEILLIGIGLSMDAFAVSICKGLSVDKLKVKHALMAGLYFGGFQALMPLIGYFLGSQFKSMITSIDHWIAFGLLVLIGANMIREALGEEGEEKNDSFSFQTMVLLAVATSIDALAVGISLSAVQANIVSAALSIGVVTAALCFVATFMGRRFGTILNDKAELLGGIILVAIGVKIVIGG